MRSFPHLLFEIFRTGETEIDARIPIKKRKISIIGGSFVNFHAENVLNKILICALRNGGKRRYRKIKKITR